MLAAVVLSTVGAPAAMLRGSYPDFAAPLYHASTSVCDAMAAPCAAAGDGTTLDTAALQACIDHCPRAPDGSFAVVLRSGRRFLSGSLNLTSGCQLVIDGVLLGSTDPADYPVVPPLPGYGPGQRDIALHGWGRHQALLSGWNMSDVVVSGRGIIDGQGLVVDPKLKSSWVSRLRSYISCKKSKGGCAGKPSASLLDFGRPRVWEPMFSSRLALVNLTVTNQAFWAVHPYACDDVYIGHVNVSAPRDEGIPNDDGIDPDSTSNLLVEDCWVSVGDNSVAIKSGMNWYGRQLGRASFNQVWRDSTFTCETFAIGSEMSGGVFNITIDNCVFGGDGSDFAGVHFKAPRERGGAIHDVVVQNSVFHLEHSVKQPMPISSSMFYGGSVPPGNRSSTPQVYSCRFSNLTFFLMGGGTGADGDAESSRHRRRHSRPKPSFQFLGLPESLMRDFHFEDLTVHAGESHGWQCHNVSGFTFNQNVNPAPTTASGCL